MNKPYQEGIARSIVKHTNMDMVDKMMRLHDAIRKESEHVNVLSSMLNSQIDRRDKGGLVDNDVVLTIKDNYRDTKIIMRMNDIDTAILDVKALLNIHKDRLERYNDELNELLNGEYNRLVEHVKLAVGGDKNE